MRVTVAGAHGQIGLRLLRRLAEDGTEVVGLIRNAEHASEIEAAGGRPVVCDLESAELDEVGAAVAGSGIVVFAAGAGPGSGPERKLTMDRDGAIKLLDASGDARYLMVSAVGAESPPADDETFSVYLQAKAAADSAVASSGREFVIVRPGRLLDDRGDGRVRLSTEPYRGDITRDDVAGILVALVGDPRLAAGEIVYAAGGETPIAQALAELSGTAG